MALGGVSLIGPDDEAVKRAEQDSLYNDKNGQISFDIIEKGDKRKEKRFACILPC